MPVNGSLKKAREAFPNERLVVGAGAAPGAALCRLNP